MTDEEFIRTMEGLARRGLVELGEDNGEATATLTAAGIARLRKLARGEASRRRRAAARHRVLDRSRPAA